jgi:hypothetical protein
VAVRLHRDCIGGQTRNRMARVDATTGLADSFDPNANNTVWSNLAVWLDDNDPDHAVRIRIEAVESGLPVHRRA